MSEDTRSIELTRIAENHYRATAPSGASIEFGRGEGLMTPVELLLAAVAGCSSIDVDTVTSRHTEPTRFDVSATADKIVEDGASRVDNVHLDFDLAFPNDEDGRKADARIERLVGLSHDKYCTVSRTVEHPTNVDFTVRRD
jgi:putative redox protein